MLLVSAARSQSKNFPVFSDMVFSTSGCHFWSILSQFNVDSANKWWHLQLFLGSWLNLKQWHRICTFQKASLSWHICVIKSTFHSLLKHTLSPHYRFIVSRGSLLSWKCDWYASHTLFEDPVRSDSKLIEFLHHFARNNNECRWFGKKYNINTINKNFWLKSSTWILS